MSDSKIDPVLISLVRNAMPSVIADEICSVQPMSTPFNKEEWPYQIDVLPFVKYKDVIPMKQWCQETFGVNEWIASVQYFAFKTEKSFTWFKLRWL